MKLKSLIDEKFGLPGNAGRDFGERFMRDFITPGNFAELWTAFEATYPELKPQLQTTFEKTNDLLRYIKPGKGDEAYRVSQMPDVVAQELNEYLKEGTVLQQDKLGRAYGMTTEDAYYMFKDKYSNLDELYGSEDDISD